MTAYYNEFDHYAAQWLRNLIAKGLIAPGEVDERSITEAHPDDLKGFTQCHFFAGIGGWSLALRMAGWDDTKPVWTGSPPCQPFSTAGKQKGQDDDRHLWPVFFDLIKSRRPSVIFGEQVAAAIRFGWIDGVFTDLEGEGYSAGAAIVPACAVNAPHKRDRLWFVADTEHNGSHGLAVGRSDEASILNIAEGKDSASEFARSGASSNVPHGTVADTNGIGRQGSGKVGESINSTPSGIREADKLIHDSAGHWDSSQFILAPDWKARRIEPTIPLLVDGIPSRVGRLRAYGNAIVPQVAAEIIKAYMEARP